MQLKYGLKKEWMEFFCTKRWLAFVIPAVVFVFLDPLTVMAMPLLMEALPADLGLDGLKELYTASQAMALQSFCSDFSQMGMLALLLAMMRTAGGDQKNKSCVMPICNGFRRGTYILSKFIVYPAAAFVISILAYLAAYAFSWFLFEDRVGFGSILLPLLAFGLFLAFAATLMLTLGCITGKGGISAIIVFILFTFVSMFLSALNLNRYNPLALLNMAGSFERLDLPEYGLTALITLAAGILLCLLTMGAFQKKRLV